MRNAVFPDVPTFLRDGIGYCALDGGTVACAATSYAVAAGRIELAIATHEDHRRRGLGAATAAALMLHCVERDIVPHWNAANPGSQRLAVRLGLRPAGICEVLWLPPR